MTVEAEVITTNLQRRPARRNVSSVNLTLPGAELGTQNFAYGGKLEEQLRKSKKVTF